jgi:CHASE3 domain sensor protein
MAADDQVIQLLQEIRDLQRQHMDNYQDALRNQREAIAMQKNALRRVRWLLGMIAVLVLCLVPLISWTFSPALRCFFRR